ncbi:dihydrofolate reductase family protein [Algoriphagus sp. PAP.12]|uniref:dihydrofolate reductase family protein n=1 Tax=Algoriphagus sp. PAP.12 TaxID=2996678 RepID=UPI00227B82BE|nr:dihydrofolate reductase family protein [Algoriphagus sp. PAP.12]
MRQITVISMITLDGVIQGPGGPEEDKSNGFEWGGWAAGYDDELSDKILMEELKPASYLLGRRTFEIWEAYWPKHGEYWPAINEGIKYVFSNSRTSSDWQNTFFINSVEEIKQLKKTEGLPIHVWGSGELIQLLLENDLVDELRLKIFPITLGKGKKLFQNGAISAAFNLKESFTNTKGLVILNLERAGKVKTGIAGA